MDKMKWVWVGRGLSAIIVLPFVFSAACKIAPQIFYPQMPEQMAAIGLPVEILGLVALLEILCIVTYVIPQTSVLGAVLFTGYLGGAMLTHLRVGQSVAMHVVFGGLIWLGLYLREPRLWRLLPLRRPYDRRGLDFGDENDRRVGPRIEVGPNVSGTLR